MFINSILSRLFYRPEKAVKKLGGAFVCANTTILRNSFQVSGIKPNEHEKRVTIGNDNILACKIVFENESGKVTIGDNCFINAGTSLISVNSIDIGNYVTIAWGVTIYDHDSHSLNYNERRHDIDQQIFNVRSNKRFIDEKLWGVVKSEPIKIKDDAWIGMNVTILKGVTVGERAVVAAGSIVTKDVPDDVVVAGNPAQIVKSLEELYK